MGLGKSIKKAFKSVGGLGMKLTGLDFAKNTLKDVLGLNAMQDLAGAQEAQLRQQQEANKLDASVESQNVAQFDDTSDSGFTGTDTRRKKKQSGAYSQALGLQL